MFRQWKNSIRSIGPGLMVAAAGVGAGDLIVGIQGGMSFGLGLLWAVILAGILKYVLNEGIARWQFQTGKTVIEGWINELPRGVSYAFLVLLLIWSFMVAGALTSACGLAGHALFPSLSVPLWGIIHSAIAAILVLWGRYNFIEQITKVLIGIMFLIVVVTAILVRPNISEILESIIHVNQPGAKTLIFAIIGGVGGSITMLSYGYWMQERGWNNIKDHPRVKLDLRIAYGFSILFVIAIMIIASQIESIDTSGTAIVVAMSEQLENVIGPYGKTIFLIGFWSVVSSSILCVWHGIPYLFSDFVSSLNTYDREVSIEKIGPQSKTYRAYLFYMSVLPICLLFLEDAIKNVINYALISLFFVVFLSITLLYMNNQSKWMGSNKNGIWTNLLLALSLILFAILFFQKM